MRKLVIEGIEATLEKDIDKTGRVTGLKQWEGKTAVIVIPKE